MWLYASKNCIHPHQNIRYVHLIRPNDRSRTPISLKSAILEFPSTSLLGVSTVTSNDDLSGFRINSYGWLTGPHRLAKKSRTEGACRRTCDCHRPDLLHVLSPGGSTGDTPGIPRQLPQSVLSDKKVTQRQENRGVITVQEGGPRVVNKHLLQLPYNRQKEE